MPRKGWYGSHWCARDLRWAIYFRHQCQCVWCGRPNSAESLDHLIPWDRSSRQPHLIVPACLECNGKRGRMRLKFWIASLPNRLAVCQRLALRHKKLNRKVALLRRDMYMSLRYEATDFIDTDEDLSDIPF